jgi:phosphoserine phosphatase
LGTAIGNYCWSGIELPWSRGCGAVRDMAAAVKLVVFDCDSTLSSLEGVDELARARGPAFLAAAEAMTNDAMDGRLAVEAVFGARLKLIKPTEAEVATVGGRYIDTVESTARQTLATLRARGWTPVILSGGFRQAIRPLADFLEIERVEAVDLLFDEAGNYLGFAEDYPTTRSGGKPIVIERLRAEYGATEIVMVGDGVSDLETKPVVDLFVGFGGTVARDKVRSGATHFIHRLSDLESLMG